MGGRPAQSVTEVQASLDGGQTQQPKKPSRAAVCPFTTAARTHSTKLPSSFLQMPAVHQGLQEHTSVMLKISMK